MALPAHRPDHDPINLKDTRVQPTRFDAIAKAWSGAASRRDALKLLVAASLGGTLSTLAGSGADAARCRHGTTRCAGRCRNLKTDARHCGTCSTACGLGETCVGGVCTCSGAGCGGGGAEAQRPFPQHVTYATGTIRPTSRSQNEQDADVRAAYDRWKTRYLVKAGTSAGGDLYRVAFGKPGTNAHDVTVSEGMGFGMVIVPLMAGYDPDAQLLFDGLWRFARAHRSRIDGRLMGWKVPTAPGDRDSAFDGDCDMALGLLLAGAQWGSLGATDYRAATTTLLAGILGSTIGPNSQLPMLGDWVQASGATFNEYTPRTSDFMLTNFRAFGRFTGDAVWNQVVAACQDVIDAIQANFSPDTGLLPDFITSKKDAGHTPEPAPPNFLEGPDDGHYSYNAGRDPWRLGTDALLTGDAASLRETRKISAWAQAKTGGDPQQIKAGYDLAGKPLSGSNYFTTFFAAPLGVAAMTVSSQQTWLNAIYDAVRSRNEDYYEDSVTLLCLLVMTGNFWDPTAA